MILSTGGSSLFILASDAADRFAALLSSYEMRLMLAARCWVFPVATEGNVDSVVLMAPPYRRGRMSSVFAAITSTAGPAAARESVRSIAIRQRLHQPVGLLRRDADVAGLLGQLVDQRGRLCDKVGQCLTLVADRVTEPLSSWWVAPSSPPFTSIADDASTCSMVAAADVSARGSCHRSECLRHQGFRVGDGHEHLAEWGGGAQLDARAHRQAHIVADAQGDNRRVIADRHRRHLADIGAGQAYLGVRAGSGVGEFSCDTVEITSAITALGQWQILQPTPQPDSSSAAVVVMARRRADRAVISRALRASNSTQSGPKSLRRCRWRNRSFICSIADLFHQGSVGEYVIENAVHAGRAAWDVDDVPRCPSAAGSH